jgi:hypothetical protein
MGKKILYQQSSGKIGVLNPAEGVDLKDVLALVPTGSPNAVINESQMPNDDDLLHFFDALTVNFSSLEVGFDLEIAKEITKDRLRRERLEFFEKNDLALRDAMLENNTDAVNHAIAERDRLRDITNLADSAKNLAELKALHP